MAQAFQRFGSRVSVFQSHPQILDREDAEAAGRVEDAFRRDGIRLFLDSRVYRVEKTAGEKRVHLECDGGEASGRGGRGAGGRRPGPQRGAAGSGGGRCRLRPATRRPGGRSAPDQQQADLRCRGRLLPVQVHPRRRCPGSNRHSECALHGTEEGRRPHHTLVHLHGSGGGPCGPELQRGVPPGDPITIISYGNLRRWTGRSPTGRKGAW